MVAATFFVELVVPFFIFAPRRLRFVAAVFIAVLQLQIFLTGNYNFFNLLAIVCAFSYWTMRYCAHICPRPSSPI